MKTKLIMLIVLVLSFGAAANEKENIKSTITDVTVYLQGAQVYRKANFTIKSGVTDIIVEGICPTIDPKSLQVKATGNLVIIDSKYDLFYPEPSKSPKPEALPLKIRNQIKWLEDSMVVLHYEIQELNDELAVLQATKNILAANGAMTGKGKVNDSIPLLKAAVDYYLQKMNEINKQMLKINRKMNEKNEKKEQMESRLSELQNFQNSNNLKEEPKGPIHRLVVTVSAKEQVSGKLSFSYLVSQAGWVPIYDLKSDASAGKINLTYKAQVFQKTGINWDDVRLSVSTNNPYQNKTKPELHPWYIDYQIAQQQRRNEVIKAPASAYIDALETNGTINTHGGAANTITMDAMTSLSFVSVVDQIISAEFKIDLPYTIQSDGEMHMVLVKNQDISADFKHICVPKMDPSVYLVAQISKLDELQLVPAKANIFFDGTYMGETYIDPSNMEDTLSLSLGKDPNIIVKRTLLKKDCKEKVIGNQKERTNSFQIEVKSVKTTDIELILVDQIPISQNADIVIEALDLDKGKLDETTGIITWKQKLRAKSTDVIKFGYRVKYNKDMMLAQM